MKTSYFVLFVFLLLLSLVGRSQTAMDYYNRGLAKYKLLNYSDAILDYTKSIEIDPKHAGSFYNRGLAKHNLQDYHGAIADYTKAIKIDSKYANAFYFRGNALQGLQNYSDAILDYTKSIEIDPKHAGSFYYRGLAKINLGQKDSGCLDLGKAKDLGNEEASEAIKQYCQNIPQEYIRSFKVNGETYDIPENEAQDFLKDFPKAKEIQSYTFDNDTIHVPLDKVEAFRNEMPEAKPLQNYHTIPTWDETIPIENESISTGADNKAKTKAETPNLHFQVDKIKVGDTFIELPIPSGFVKVDDTMGNLLETAKLMCPKTNTFLSYYISEEDYANYLVNPSHTVEKYIIVEVFNDFKNIQIDRKDYRQFIDGFKKKYVEESKQIYDEVGVKASENLSNIDERINMKIFKMQPLGICYESKNSISYGVLTKYNFTVENESSEDYIVAAISTITKIENKPIFLFAYKIYNRSEDISSLKSDNLMWIKEIEKNQSSVSFLADIDFEDYKETILAILTLSFIWAIYFATKKIHRKMKPKNISENLEKKDKEDFIDFDELLTEETLSVEPISIEHEKIQQYFPIFNPDLLKASRRLRLFHALIDMTFLYLTGYCIGLYMGGNAYFASFVIEYPYLIGPTLLFIVYFSQELIFGKTLGKHITGTRVVNNLGIKPTVWQLILRTASRLIPFEGLSFLTSDKRGWHDTISNTYVIKD